MITIPLFMRFDFFEQFTHGCYYGYPICIKWKIAVKTTAAEKGIPTAFWDTAENFNLRVGYPDIDKLIMPQLPSQAFYAERAI